MKNPSNKKRLLVPILISTVVALGVILSYNLRFFDTWQEQLTDRFFIKSKAPSNIIIVGIDSESINKIGSWPFTRKIFADLLVRLQKAKKIAFDINFSENSRLGLYDDNSFASAINTSVPKIILPVILREDGELVSEPIVLFSNTEKAFVNIFPDADGNTRKALTTNSGYPSLAKLLAEQDNIPNKFRIFYYGNEKTFLTIPMIDILEGNVREEVFQDSTVLIGATSPDLHDFVRTPVGDLPGVEAHANILGTLQENKFFEESPFWLTSLLILIASLIPTIVILKVKKFYIFLITLIGIFIFINLSAIIFFSYFIIIPNFYISLGFILSSAILIIWHYITESKEKRFIRNAFKYYLTPEVIEEIISNPDKLRLGGENKELVIFFSDIRGFTTISESLGPEKLVSLMNRYLTLMTDIVMKHKGLVDKYIGDAVMAFWGAPLDNLEKVLDACKAVKEMSEKLRELNEQLKKEGSPEIKIGMGLTLGEVIVGNMGSERRFNYTVMGDSVNLASRLESLTKNYGVETIVSEPFANALSIVPSSPFSTKKLDEVIVKGKTLPTKIFQLIF